MKYNCVIKEIEDDEEVTIKIGNTIITGFVNMGLSIPIDKETEVEIEFYDDIEIEETQIREKSILSKGTYSYSIYGILDIDNGILRSTLDFSIDRDYLYEYGFLDGKYVEVKVNRLDFYFD